MAERCAEDTAVGLVRERTAARRIAALGALAEARVTMDRRPGDPPRREVVVHVDAGVLADDTAAGRAYFEGGPAITGAQARRMLCEATAVVMLEQGREPLAVGRRRRRATKAQRRALLRRDGGCARPGCPETRIERLHAHHMRHWLYGGRTELANLVLLCDTDHGLVHDHDLVLSRRSGRLIVLTPDGRHIWGTADAAFITGLAGATATETAERAGSTDPFVGVHPIDDVAGRRPTGHGPDEPGRRRRSAARSGVAPPVRPAAPLRPAAPSATAPDPRAREQPHLGARRRPDARRTGAQAAPSQSTQPPRRTGTRGRPTQPRPLPRRRTTARRLAPGALRPHGSALRHRSPDGQPRPRPTPRRRGRRACDRLTWRFRGSVDRRRRGRRGPAPVRRQREQRSSRSRDGGRSVLWCRTTGP